MVKVAAKEEEKQGHQNKALKLIEKPRARKLTYANRKDCILKKTMELSILCGTKACTVCIGPNGEVQTWPENQTEVRNIIDSYKQYKKKPGQSFDHCLKPLDQSFGGLGEKAGDGENLGVKKEVFESFFLGFDGGWIYRLSADSLEILLRDLEGKLEELSTRIGFLEKVNGKKKIVGSEDLAPYWFGGDAPMEFLDMVGSGSGFGQPLQNLGLDSLSNTFHPLQTMVGFDDDPLSSTTPLWPLDYYSGSMIGCDAPMSTIWPVDCYGDAMGGNGGGGGNGRFVWSCGERLEETDLNSMSNIYNNQFLASSGIHRLSPLDEVVIASMFAEESL